MAQEDNGFANLFGFLVDEDGALYVSVNPYMDKKMNDDQRARLTKIKDETIELIAEILNTES